MKNKCIVVRCMVAAGALALVVTRAPICGARAGDLPASSNVTLNLTAVNGSGEPVSDLAQDEIHLFADGKPQPIAGFQDSAAKSQAGPQPTTVILFDLMNAIPLNREYTSTFIVRSLQPLEVADSVYFYIFSNRAEFYPVHAMPDSTAAAPAPASDPRGSAIAEPWTKQIQPLLDQAVAKVYGFRPKDDRDWGYRPAVTFRALNAMGEALANVPGAKTIMWITTGVENWPNYPFGCKDISFPDGSSTYVAGKCTDRCRLQVDCIDYVPFFEHFSAKLNRDNTVIDVGQDLPTGAMPFIGRGTPSDTLERLTSLTGGRLYTGNTVNEAITQALRSSRARYQISFVPARTDGKFHKLRVTCDRKEVHLTFPRGYYAE